MSHPSQLATTREAAFKAAFDLAIQQSDWEFAMEESIKDEDDQADIMSLVAFEMNSIAAGGQSIVDPFDQDMVDEIRERDNHEGGWRQKKAQELLDLHQHESRIYQQYPSLETEVDEAVILKYASERAISMSTKKKSGGKDTGVKSFAMKTTVKSKKRKATEDDSDDDDDEERYELKKK